jgi:hypothetical protein
MSELQSLEEQVLNADETEEAEEEEAKEEPKPELTPERKAELERAAALSDMLLSARQDMQNFDMNLLRLEIHNSYWQRRCVETEKESGKAHDKILETAGNVQRQIQDTKSNKAETGKFIAFLDERMRGEAEKSA